MLEKIDAIIPLLRIIINAGSFKRFQIFLIYYNFFKK